MWISPITAVGADSSANSAAAATSSGRIAPGFGVEKNGVSTRPGVSSVTRPPQSAISSAMFPA